MTSTSVYRAIVVELERKRLAMGISMDMMAELMGVAERSYAKLLYPDTASGRQASWDKLQKAIDVLFSGGFDVIVRPGATATETGPGTKRLIRQSAAHYDRRTQREVMSEIGRRAKPENRERGRLKIPKRKRKAIAKHAATERWLKTRGKQIENALCSSALEHRAKTRVCERKA